MSPAGRKALQAMLLRQEGLRLKMYTDTTGHATIGVGRNIGSEGISEDEALYLLANDEMKALRALNSHLAWFSGLDEPRQIALASCAFNLGIEGLLEFHTMLTALSVNDWQKAHDACLDSLAARQDKARYAEIAGVLLTGELNN